MSKAIIFDTETTGLDPRKDEILTLSVIDGDGKTLWDRAYRPSNVTVWPQAEAVNHISPESVAMCPEICEDERELSELFSSADLIIGYNVKFDLGFLAAVGIYPREDAEVHDTMLDFAELYGVVDAKRHTWKWQKLTFAADHVGYDWGKDVAHGSLADARATLAVQQWCNRKCGVGVSEAEDVVTLAGAGLIWDEGRSTTVKDLYREYLHFLRALEPGYDSERDELRLREGQIYDSLQGSELDRANAALDALMETDEAAWGGDYFSGGKFRIDYMRSYKSYVDEAVDDGDISREVGDAAMRQMRRDFDRIVGRKD